MSGAHALKVSPTPRPGNRRGGILIPRKSSGRKNDTEGNEEGRNERAQASRKKPELFPPDTDLWK